MDCWILNASVGGRVTRLSFEFGTSRCKKTAASLTANSLKFMANFWRETQTISSSCKQITSSNFFTVTSLELNRDSLPLTDTINNTIEWRNGVLIQHISVKPPLISTVGIRIGIVQCE